MSLLRSLSGAALCGNSLVRLIYLDESGISSNERIAVVAGVIIDADQQWLEVAKEVESLIAANVPTDRRRNFSFHAKDLFHGTGGTLFDRRTYPLEQSHQALQDLLGIPSKFHLPVVFGYADKQAPGSHKLSSDVKPRERIAIDTAIAFSMCAVAAEAFMKDKTTNELATMHAVQNTDTQKMIRLARKSLGGRGRFNLAEMLSAKGQSYMPITKIIDEISFHNKDDAFLLQLADACALILRYALEGRKNCDGFFQALFTDSDVANELRKQVDGGAAGYNLLMFA